ncbi:MAG: 50S ribosomal protein L17 [Clostridia bacterium]|nr:50S ribosomal protein L17 [Clostridia bacterium]
MPGTRKLGRTTAHRMLMLRGMVTYLLEHGEIKTTVTRAKEVRSLAEKMITIAKTQKPNKLAAYRKALAFITKEKVVEKLFETIAPAYENKTSGFTAIYKMGPRRGDGAEMAIVRLIGMPVVDTKAAKKAPAKKVEAPALDQQ